MLFVALPLAGDFYASFLSFSVLLCCVPLMISQVFPVLYVFEYGLYRTIDIRGTPHPVRAAHLEVS